MKSPLPAKHSPRSDWLRLPLPVNGTRYLAAGLLVLVIFGVVLATYVSIERDLQSTLEERLSGMLRQQVAATLDFITEKQRNTEKVAAMLDARQHADQKSGPKDVHALLAQWIDLGAAEEAFVVTLPNEKTHYSYPPSATLPAPVLERIGTYSAQTPGLDFFWVKQHQRIYTWHKLSGGTQLLVVGFSPRDLVQRLDPHHEVGVLHSYAFDRQGWLSHDDPSQANAGESLVTNTFPRALRRQTPDMQLSRAHPDFSPLVGEFSGRNGQPVVAAWAWLSDYQLGVVTELYESRAHSGIDSLRRSFLILVTLVGAAFLGFLALGRWTLRIREESLLMTRRLSRLSRTIQPLSAALEHDPSAVILVDQDGSVIYANAASHRVLCVHEPLIGQDADAVFEQLPKELQSALASGQDSIVARGGETDGETLLVSSHSLTIEGAQHFLYMLRPVTQQVRRQEVEHWKKLIRVLSHELNNALAPITSLLSSARKLNQMTHQDPRLGQIFESISERTAHLVAFIEGYREVARLPRPAPRTVDWDSFVQSIQSQKHITLVGTLPTTPGYFDPIQLERVVINLIKNSYEAGSPRDEIELEVVEEDERFRLNIMDRGSGMPEAVLKQAMLPFFSTKRTGTGVGLALSREIIEAHDGQLALANREGGGLVVSCSLPKAPPQSRASLGKMLVAPLSRPG